MKSEGMATEQDIERLRRLADAGRDLATGEPAADYHRKCHKCGEPIPQNGHYFCGKCRGRIAANARARRDKGVGKMSRGPMIEVGGQATDGVPAAPPIRPGTDPVGEKAARPPSQTGVCACGAKIWTPGGRCRTCAGLARRRKPLKTPTAAPAALPPRAAAPRPSAPPAAATRLPGPTNPAAKGAIERMGIAPRAATTDDREVAARACRDAARRLLAQAVNLLQSEDILLGRAGTDSNV